MARKIIAYHLLFTFLLCTFQVGITQHICCGKVSETKLFFGHGSASCGMETMENNKCQSPQIKKNCCHDELAKFQFLQKFSSSDYTFTLFNHFSTQFIACGFNSFSITEPYNKQPLCLYAPPNILDPNRKLAKLQVFII